jgi:hypothetical protein
MQTTSTIPVTISDEAAARVAELGMQREFEQILEHTRQMVPGLRKIEVSMDYAPWLSTDPAVILDTYRSHPGGEDDPTQRNWGRWLIDTFPTEVWMNFCMLTVYE